MFRLVGILVRPLRRHPWTAAGILFLLFLVAVGGINLWALHHFRAAERDVDAGRFEEAGVHVASCLRVWWRSAPTQRLAARIARLRGRYPEAETYLVACQHIEGEPSDPTKLEWVLLRAQRGELVEVEAELWYLVSKDHADTTVILEALVRGYLTEMRLPAALVALNRWLERQPDTVRALGLRARVQNGMHNRDQAAQDYRRLLELEPDSANARLELANMLVGAARPDEAAPHVAWLREHDPENVDVQVLQAQCLSLQGKADEALRLLDAVLAAHPDHVPALLKRGKVELERGQPAAAEHWFRRALKLDPYSLEGRVSLCKSVQEQEGREQEAAELFRRSETLRKDLDRMIEMFMSGQLEKAARNAHLATEVGELFFRIGRDGLALQWLGIALKVDPNHRPTHRALARYFERKGQPERATEHRRLGGPEPEARSSGR